MFIQSYLFFDGRCEEALEFYKKAVGAEVTMLMRFKDSPEKNTEQCGGAEDKVMHASLRIGGSEVMASDGRCEGKPSFQGFALSLSVENEAEAKQVFSRLSEGGQVHQALTKTFFSPLFGMLADRFGVNWMVLVVTPEMMAGNKAGQKSDKR